MRNEENSMEPMEAVASALEIAESSKVPERYREAAFREILRNHLALAPGAPARESPGQPATAPRSAAGSALDELARRVARSRDAVAEIYEEEDGDLQLVVAPSRVAPSVAAGAKEVALLVAGGRQLAGHESWTSSDVIRDACKNYSRFDSSNFASSLASLTTEFTFRGRGQKREVKLTRPGVDSLQQLIDRLTSREG